MLFLESPPSSLHPELGGRGVTDWVEGKLSCNFLPLSGPCFCTRGLSYCDLWSEGCCLVSPGGGTTAGSLPPGLSAHGPGTEHSQSFSQDRKGK